MIIDFTVSNFRSIKEPVTLSFVEVSPRKTRQKGGARKRPQKTDEEIAPALEVPGWDFKLLRTVGIFGANASGKSNVVRALGTLLLLLDRGPGDRANHRAADPFLLDRTCRHTPSRFELRLAHGDTGSPFEIFAYTLEISDAGVADERLTRLWLQHSEMIFSRTRKAPLECGEMLPVAMRDMSVAAGTPLLHVLLANFDVPALRGLMTAIKNTLSAHEGRDFYLWAYARVVLKSGGQLASSVANLLHQFDTNIAGFRVETDEDGQVQRVLTTHASAGGDIEWDLADESAGTREVFNLGPAVLHILDMGSVLVLDEFGAHLHPHITRRIVELFQNPETNPKGAQLLFNSHDNTLMRDALLRRDQIWFTAKREDGSTNLYALSDFKPRNDLAIDTAYLDGRMGAVPVMPSLAAMIPAAETGEARP